VKQHLSYILKNLQYEVSTVEKDKDLRLVDEDKTERIIEKLNDYFNDESKVAPFLSFGTSVAFGPTLKTTTDESTWLQQQIIGLLPALKTRLHLIAELTTAMDNGLRALAWYFARGVWMGAEKSITSELMMTILSYYTKLPYGLNTLDEISKEVRPEKVKPAKEDGGKKKGKKEAEVSAPENEGLAVAEAVEDLVA
jgi:hypothetical protein